MRIRTQLLVATFAMGAAVPANAQTRPVNLAEATLEDLMNIEITSASRKEQRAEDVPAAVYVVTHDEIRRSGMTSVPDVLRLVPGVQVAQINSNKWAISVRGFDSVYSNKLLVLVDGRTVYNPLFAGVLWDTEDLMLEDVDRIEVIRGPGAAVWGTNAVNGIINIVTRPAADTTGLLVRAGAGPLDRGSLAIRYGGAAGSSGAYRAYAQLSVNGNSVIAPETSANDHWRSFTSGFRGDWTKSREAYMVQGSVSAGHERPLWVSLDPRATPLGNTDGESDFQVGNVLSRWTHARASGASFQLQSFVDVSKRDEPIGKYHRVTADLDAIYHTAVGVHHDLVVGAGYRHINEGVDGGLGYSFHPSRVQETQVNAFAQDEIALAGRRVLLTLGSKFVHESDDGSNLQPTARLMWRVTPDQRLWAAVSRALRGPSLVDKGVQIDFPTTQSAIPGTPPVAVSVYGNPAAKDESLLSTEAGYRRDIGSIAAIDVVGFIGRYQSLQTSEPSAPSLIFVDGRPVISVSTVFQNLLAADTRGAEIAARLRLSAAWQVDGSVSTFHLTPHPAATSHDPTAPLMDGNAPAYQWRGHSAWSIGPSLQADVLLFYVGSLGQLAIPAYTRADARFEWKLTGGLSAIVQGQNLLSRSHAEFGGSQTSIVSTQVPRTGSLRLTWRF